MTDHFSLIDEPWVPVVTGEVSLARLFENGARDFDRLRGLTAIEEVALVRILSAIVIAAGLGVKKPRQLPSSVEAGIDGPTVLEYLESQRDRFGLFDEKFPFMQSFEEPQTNETTSAVLRLDLSSGNNATLVSHQVDTRPPALTPGAALRAMLATLLYQPGGGVSKPFNRSDSPGAKRLMALVRGANLGETLLLNSPIIKKNDKARPAWERGADKTPLPEGTAPSGWLEFATWRSRAVRLYRDEDGLVRRCRLQQHLKLSDEPPSDPYVPRIDRDGEVRALRPSPTKPIWRQSDAVLQGFVVNDASFATNVLQAADAARTLGRTAFPVTIVGLVVNQAKISDLQVQDLPVSDAFFKGDGILAVEWALRAQAEKGESAIVKALWEFFRSTSSNAKESSRPAISEALTRYWYCLEPSFLSFIWRVAAGEPANVPTDALQVGWNRDVRRAAWSALDTSLDGHVLTGEGLRARAEIDGMFRRLLPGNLDPSYGSSEMEEATV